MKRGWKLVLIIVLAAIVLGAVCTGVGMITGADVDRIYAVLDEHYHIGMYYEYVIEVINALQTQL